MAALKFDPSKIRGTSTAAVPQGFSLVGQSPTESREAVQVPIQMIDPYTDPYGGSQPFRMYAQEAMEQLIESVQQNGRPPQNRLQRKPTTVSGVYSVIFD